MKRTRIPKYERQAEANRVRGYARFYDAAGHRRRKTFPGEYGSEKSRAAYLAFLNQWQAGAVDDVAVEGSVRRATRSTLPSADEPLTVGEIVAAFLRHADVHYRKNGEPTSEAGEMRYAATPLVEAFGDLPAEVFGPRHLREVREVMVESGRLARSTINNRVRRIRTMFYWATGEQLVPGSVAESIRHVKPLQKGRTSVREAKPIEPVPLRNFEATLEHLTPTLRTMCRLLYQTGARPGEIYAMRWQLIDRAASDDGSVWVYRPPSHKNEHRGIERTIGLGPESQRMLAAYEDLAADEPFFSPRRSDAEARLLRRQRRTTPMTPSGRERARRNADAPRRQFRALFDKDTFRHAVSRACRAAGVPHWHPMQIRHLVEDELEARFGLEFASRVLGHTHLATTQNYRRKSNLRETIEAAQRRG